MPTLHIHLDESGDWKFTPKASRYFILAAAWTYDPRPLAHAATALRFGLIRDGLNIEAFHAAPDKQTTRNAFVSTIMGFTDWRFAAVVLEKCKINPVLREPQRFYPKFAGSLLKFILNGRDHRGVTKALVYADTIPMDTNAKREGVLKAIKTTCSTCLPSKCSYVVFSHRLESNCWIQVADYCCWAVKRKWESGDTRTYDQIKQRLAAPELDLTSKGDGTVYY